MFPVLITSLIAYSLLSFNLMFNIELSIESNKFTGWLGQFYNFDASFKDVIKFSFYDAFFNSTVDKSYNSVLWTMPIELVGSFIIFVYLALFRSTENISWKLVLILTMMLLIWSPFYASFIIGYVIVEINKKYTQLFTQYFLPKNVEIFLLSTFFILAILSTYFKESNYITCFFCNLLCFYKLIFNKIKIIFF